jgi:uncharacterized protein (TIGR00156 family)
MTVATVAMVKNIHTSNTLILLRGKIIDFLGEGNFLFEDNTGTMTIKINSDLLVNLPADRTQTIEITGKIILKYPENEIEVENVRAIIE